MLCPYEFIGAWLMLNRAVLCYNRSMNDDQVIDAAMARSLHADAVRAHPIVGWIVTQDPPDCPDRFVARLVTAVASPYVLVADTLAEVQAALPQPLKRSARPPADLPDVVEIWFAE